MPFVSITRLRVRSWSYMPAFVVQTLRIARQAARASGNLAVKLLWDRQNTFWTCTTWSSEDSAKAFMHAKPHGPTMRSLLNWCDEAALAHWTQVGEELPSLGGGAQATSGGRAPIEGEPPISGPHIVLDRHINGRSYTRVAIQVTSSGSVLAGCRVS